MPLHTFVRRLQRLVHPRSRAEHGPIAHGAEISHSLAEQDKQALTPLPLPLAQQERSFPDRLRERLDVSLFLRRLFGVTGFWMTWFLPRRKLMFPKEYWVHGVVLLLVGAVVGANLFTTAADRGSLLFALFGEGEIEEGAVPPQRSREAAARGALIGLIPSAVAGGVSEDDIEFELANTLGGNALISTDVPETAEASAVRREGVVAYAVKDGDTPSSIAARYGVSTNSVLWSNGIRDGDLIRPGDILVILPVSGVLHTVAKGDDVVGIAKKYDAKAEDIIAQNDLGESGAIRIGQKLVIPDGQLRATPRPVIARHEEPEDTSAPQAPAVSAPRVPGADLLWPISATRGISQYFGWRHTGIDLPDRSHQSVKAAQDGTVSFSGWLGGYGRLVIIDHGGVKTYYAHLSAANVTAGQKIGRGEVLGKVGSTGRSSGPHLHFEVRQNDRPVNPIKYF
ncbi:MAG: Peptidase M23 [Parcubacteria group bacterium Gr01-1014_106]|nr:MAG: Peptidase M23 [Parcubacteria group bacterium Gr01-1014_106]